MKTESKTTDSATDRHLGPLASLMRAAEPLEELTADERERIRHRLHAGVVASHRPAAGFRWSTAFAALGLLLAGGAVFAAAGHFGLIPWPRETKLQHRERAGSQPGAATASASCPAQPCVPSTGTVSEGEAPPAQTAVCQRRSRRQLWLRPPRRRLRQRPSRRRLVPCWPGWRLPLPSKRCGPSVRPISRQLRLRRQSRRAATSRDWRGAAARSTQRPRFHRRRSRRQPVAAPALAPPAAAPVAPEAGPHLAMLAPADSPARASHWHAPAPAPKAANGQAMLGQALRSLRNDHDPLLALDTLARHAALVPAKSPGQRALHAGGRGAVGPGSPR